MNDMSRNGKRLGPDLIAGMTAKSGDRNTAAAGAGVRIPEYDRSRVTPGIVHFGVGGFHRAHQAVFTDDVLALEQSRSGTSGSGWGICGAGITGGDERMYDALAPQKFLYTVVARDVAGSETRIVGSIIDYILGTHAAEKLIARIADPSTRIVSMTITENGYFYRPESIDLDTESAEVRSDLEGPAPEASSRTSPLRTVYGYLHAALKEIRKRGTKPPTILSCDNLPQNGDRLRKLTLQFLDAKDRDLAAFVRRNVEFPNCMVDRITPITTDEERRELLGRTGIDDGWPVYCEKFRQWVIEDRFPAGHPDWSRAGATFVTDVVPFERMKIRLLNGSHSTIGYIGYLLGHRRVDLAMADPDLRRYVQGYMNEIKPTVGNVPGIDLDDYIRSLIDRFSNPAIADQILRLAQDGSKKIPNMILEPVSELLHEARPFPQAAFAFAAWIRFLEAKDEAGEEIVIDDPLASELTDAARLTRNGDILPFLELKRVFPPGMSKDRNFASAVGSALKSIRESGTRRALRAVVGGA